VTQPSTIERPATTQSGLPFVSRALIAATVLVASAIAAGCAAHPSPVSLTPTLGSPTPNQAADEALLTEVVARRHSLGLPNERAYVRALFEDSAAVRRGVESGYGFPITQLELTALESRARSMSAVKAAIEAYAANHLDSWAGMYVAPGTSTVVARFVGDVLPHKSALAALLHPAASIEIVTADWSLNELEELRSRMHKEEAWFRSVDSELKGLGVDVMTNRLDVEVGSDRPNIADLVARHFDAVGRIAVHQGRGPWLGARGDLTVVVHDGNGNPVPNLECSIHPDDAAAWGDDIRVTDEAGQCRFKGVGATGVTVVIRDVVGDEVVQLGQGQTTVRADRTTRIVFTVSAN
jgi:hypothetical protein